MQASPVQNRPGPTRLSLLLGGAWLALGLLAPLPESTLARTESAGPDPSARQEQNRVDRILAGTDAREQRDRLRGYIKGFVDRGAVPAAAMRIVWSERSALQITAGLDHERRIPIASLTKSFTALAVMQLVEHGHIQLDEPVTRYGVKISGARKGAGAITTRHLLQQTSGILYGTRHQSGPAGERFTYSNGNYAHLARLIENVSGLEGHEYIRANILVPLEMDDSRVSKSYSGSSGIASTAADLARFGAMLQAEGAYPGGRIIEAETLREMLKPPPFLKEKTDGVYYAHGFRVDLADGDMVSFFHAGLWNGCFAEVRVFPGLNAFLISMATPESYRNQALNDYRWHTVQRAHKYLKSLDHARRSAQPPTAAPRADR